MLRCSNVMEVDYRQLQGPSNKMSSELRGTSSITWAQLQHARSSLGSFSPVLHRSWHLARVLLVQKWHRMLDLV